MSRITIVVIGDDEKIEQVMKQLNKLIDVIKVSELTDSERVERELARFLNLQLTLSKCIYQLRKVNC